MLAILGQCAHALLGQSIYCGLPVKTLTGGAQEDLPDVGGGKRFGDVGLANMAQEDQPNVGVAILFVAQHEFNERVGICPFGQFGR